MERKARLSEEEMLIHKNIQANHSKQIHSSANHSKWYDSWSNLNWGFLFITIVLLVSSIHDIVSQYEGKGLFALLFSKEVDKNTIQLKGIVWRTFYFHFFLIFSGGVGYINRFSFGKHLSKNTPYHSFYSWRDLLLKCSLIMLNVVWLINCLHYDLSIVPFFQNPFKWLFKLSYLWLDLLWSLAVLFCTRNTIFQYIVQSSYTTTISLHKKIGALSFILTFLHILLGFTKIVHHNPTSLFEKIWNFAPMTGFSLDYHSATTLLLRGIVLILLLFLSTFSWVRNHNWELFHLLHIVLIPILLVLLFFHSKRLRYTLRLPVLLFAIDKCMRVFSRLTRRSYIAHITSHNGLIVMDVAVRHRFFYRRPFGRLIGAVVYVNIPEISRLEYHPLSVAYSYQNHLVFFVRVVGAPHSWTHRLASLVERNVCSVVYLEGPYCMEHHREIAEQGIPPVVSTLNLMKAVQPLDGGTDYYSRVLRTYGTNVLFVAGGVGLAGISSYILDLLHALERIPEEKRSRIVVTIVVVVAEPEHMQGMYNVLCRCQQSPLCSFSLFCTYRSNPALKAELSSKSDSCSIRPDMVSLESFDRISRVIDIENSEFKDLKYTVGRPNLRNIIQSLPYQECSVFVCGPQSLAEDCYRFFREEQRIFSYHSEVFDM